MDIATVEVNFSTGFHRLYCAGRSKAQELAIENRCLDLPAVDTDEAMRRQWTLVNSKARGDLLVLTTDLEITDSAQGHGCSHMQVV
jgi:hypothetical protein